MRPRAWLRAARPASQSYIALPLLLGQALAYRYGQAFDLSVLCWVQLFGVLDQLFIVFANDYADRETDRDNATPTAFSGGSRVLVDGQLPPERLASAARWAAAGLLLVCAVLAIAYRRPWALPLGLLALSLLWSYSYRPLALSYRGGGELLQLIGVGLCLPLFGYYAQLGTLAAFPWPLFWVLLPTQLACAVATGLPDEPSDRRARKRTAAVLLGPDVARALVGACNGLSVTALICQPGLAFLPLHASALLVLLPALTTLASFLVPLGAPGSRTMVAQVALAVATTLGVVTIVAITQLIVASNPP
jgi:1,4-dihydroxy-2-naphthoate octaprenyltransferase